MNSFTANYSNTNHKFVIQNLTGERITNKYIPAILILKNILQRGKPTLMSKYLQNEIDEIHKFDNFNKLFALIDKELPIWHNTVKGDEIHNYYPARTFFETLINEYLPEYKYITQLIRPETPI